MGLPGFTHRLSSSRAVAALPLLVLLCIGCGNPFTQFYTGRNITQLKSEGVVLPEATTPPKVISVGDVNASLSQYRKDGWYYMGRSSWVGPGVVFWQNDATSHAKQIGASLVLVSWKHSGTRSVTMPVTTPTTSTTYVGGTVYGGYGSASYSGVATTYGTQTSYYSVPVPQYDYHAVFLCKPTSVPRAPRSTTPGDSLVSSALGVEVSFLRPSDQEQSGTSMGVRIESVVTDGPAMKAGLQVGDVIVRVGYAAVVGEVTYAAAVRSSLGTLVELEIYRRGEVIKSMVQLGNGSQSPPESESPSSADQPSPYRSRAPAE